MSNVTEIPDSTTAADLRRNASRENIARKVGLDWQRRLLAAFADMEEAALGGSSVSFSGTFHLTKAKDGFAGRLSTRCRLPDPEDENYKFRVVDENQLELNYEDEH